MRVGDLIEALQEFDPELEVRIAYQPSWPLEMSIGQVVKTEKPRVITRERFEAMSEEEQERAERQADRGEVVFEEDEDKQEVKEVVYLAESSPQGYLDPAAVRALEWGRCR